MSHTYRNDGLSPSHGGGRRRAFTLVEVLIVVTIIGIAGAIVVPHMLSASTLGIQAGARMVIADLLYAQNEAIVQQKPRSLTVDTSSEIYWLADENGNKLSLTWRTAGATDLVDFANDDRFRGVTLAKVTESDGDYTFVEDDGTVTFTFDELGAPANGGHIGLIAGEQRFVVSVAAFTGRVTVKAIE